MAKKKRNRQQSSRPTTTASDQPALSSEEQAARRAQQKREWAEQKRGKERAASGSLSPLVWAGSGIAAVVIAVIVGVVLIAGGGGSSSGTPTPGPTADPRLVGAPPAESLAVSAKDDGQNVNPRFNPTTITAKAGEVFEIDVKNDGSVHHNLVVAGLDGQYDTNDDWTTTPSSIAAGESGKVLVKIDKAGTYKFHCVFHPDQQTGTLILTPAPSASASPSATANGTPEASPSP